MTTTLTRPNSSLLKLSWPILLELLLQILVGNVDQAYDKSLFATGSGSDWQC